MDAMSLTDGERLLTADGIMGHFRAIRVAAVAALRKDAKEFAKNLYTDKGAIRIDKKCRNGALSFESTQDARSLPRTPQSGSSFARNKPKGDEVERNIHMLLEELENQAARSFRSQAAEDGPLEELGLPQKLIERLQTGERIAEKLPRSQMLARGYVCDHCQSLNSLLRDAFPLPVPIDGELVRKPCVPIEIEHGAWEGIRVLYLHEKVFPNVDYAEENLEVKRIAIRRLATNDGLKSREKATMERTISYLGLDAFASRAMINWTLQEMFAQRKLRNSTEHVMSFICGSVGTHVVEAPDLSSFERHKSAETALALVHQAFQVLDLLESVDYRLTTPGWQLSVIRSTQTLRLNKKTLRTPLALLFGDLSNAAMTLETEEGPLRLYNNSGLYVKQRIRYKQLPPVDYRVPGFDWQEARRFVVRGISGGVPQMELYLLIGQLMLMKGFADAFRASEISGEILGVLFSDEDQKTFLGRLEASAATNGQRELSDISCAGNAMSLLRGLTLKGDAFRRLKTILDI